MKSLLCIQRCSWKQQPRLAQGTNSMVPSSSLFLGVGHGARAQREPRTVWNSSCSYEEVCSGGTQVGRAESLCQMLLCFQFCKNLVRGGSGHTPDPQLHYWAAFPGSLGPLAWEETISVIPLLADWSKLFTMSHLQLASALRGLWNFSHSCFVFWSSLSNSKVIEMFT